MTKRLKGLKILEDWKEKRYKIIKKVKYVKEFENSLRIN